MKKQILLSGLIPEEYRMKMAAFHFNNGLRQNKEVVICHKQNDLPMNCSVLDFEQGGRRETHPMPCQLVIIQM